MWVPMHRWTVPLAALLLAGAVAPTVAPTGAGPPAWVTIDADTPGEPSPRALLGANGAPETAGVASKVRDADLPWARVDAYLDRVHANRGDPDWVGFDDRLSRAATNGTRPVLILAYTPAWLADCHGPGYPDRIHCPPSDLDVWQELVREAAVRAQARHGVRTFEVWNEPDNPGFWRGTLREYLRLYEATVAGIRDAEQATGKDLDVGGPAAVGPDPVYIPALLGFASDRGLPVDFVSFHWYGDYPFHGPIGPSPGTVVHDSPLLLARTYRDHARQVRTWTDAAGYEEAGIWIDEWNVNAGDAERMRGRFGAAFVAGVVAEMHRGPVDRASFYNLQHDAWGLFAADGTPRPSWQAFDALAKLQGKAVPADREGNPHVHAVASRAGDGTVRAIVSVLDAQARQGATVHLRVPDRLGASYEVRRLDGTLVTSGTLPEELVLPMPDLAVWTVAVGAQAGA